MEVFPLFASPLVQIKVKEDINKLNDIVSKEPFAFTKSSGSYNAQISKDRRILERYLDLKELLLDYFNQFSEEVLRYDGEFNITTSWFTKIKTGCSSQYHFHKNSFYSGVYYFDNYTLQQIGDKLGYTAGYARKKKNNCLKYLKNEIEKGT